MIEQRLKYHPYKIFVYGVIAGLIFLFLSLSVSFVYTDFQSAYPQMRLPLVFHFNTAIIIISSVFLRKAEFDIDKENALKVRNRVGVVFVLGVVFMVLQYIGWKELVYSGVSMRGSQAGSYLFLLSGLHAFHILIGLFFLLNAIVKIHKCATDEIACLVYFSDPVNKMSFKLTAFYWHFVDFLWVFLYLIFLLVMIF